MHSVITVQNVYTKKKNNVCRSHYDQNLLGDVQVQHGEHDGGECDLCIATSQSLWREYVDVNGEMAADEFEAMSVDERLEIIRSCGW
jgi:hypothetical protein